MAQPPLHGDTPLIDEIFPNRETPRQRTFEPTSTDLDRMAGMGFTERRAFRHRRVSMARRVLNRGKPVETLHPIRKVKPGKGSVTTASPSRGRRKVLLGIAGSAVAVTGVGGAISLVSTLTSSLGGRGDSAPSAPVDLNALAAGGLAESPSDAARVAAAAIAVQLTPLSPEPELHLLKRVTFGPTLPELLAVRQMGIDDWIERQLTPKSFADPDGQRVLDWYPTVGMSTAQVRGAIEQFSYDAMYQLGHATLARQMWSSRQLFEVMADFWANHLNVTNPFDGGWDVRGPYDKDVIRKHALGKYSDMLLASARHPAMMRYLDNARSDARNINENYGRELLELHTVGVGAKYTQKDVRNSAYIMTGRTVDNEGRFYYDMYRHWTGKVKVLGFTHSNKSQKDGLKLGDTYVKYLAKHPKTAQRIAKKLAIRFVTDRPPQELVDRLAKAYLDNDTAIVPVLRVLFRSVEFWVATGLKTRRPLENLVATARVLGVEAGSNAKDAKDGIQRLYYMSEQLGQAPLAWPPPDGYSDLALSWNSAHATLGVWNSHRALTQGYIGGGLRYPDPGQLVGLKPKTAGEYVDKLSQRLVFQKMTSTHRAAVLKFLGLKSSTKVADRNLGGKIQQLVPMILDSVYHGLR